MFKCLFSNIRERKTHNWLLIINFDYKTRFNSKNEGSQESGAYRILLYYSSPFCPPQTYLKNKNTMSKNTISYFTIDKNCSMLQKSDVVENINLDANSLQ